MPDENDGEEVQGNPGGESLGVPPPKTKITATKEESATVNLEKDIRRGEVLLVRLGVANLVMSAIIAYVYYGQLTQMRSATEATRACFINRFGLKLGTSV